MSYASRRPRLFVPRNELFVPNMLMSSPLSLSVPTQSAITANRAYYIPFSAPYDTAVKSISCAIVTAAGNYDLGLYDATGTRLGSLGSTALSTTGVKTWTPSTPISVAADSQYFASAAFSSATAEPINFPSFSIFPVLFLIQASAFALPSSWTTPTSNISAGVRCPLLLITFSN